MLWMKRANRLGLKPEFIEGDWRGGADAEAIAAHLREDKGHEIQGGLCGAQRDLHRFVSPIAECGGRSTRRVTPRF